MVDQIETGRKKLPIKMKVGYAIGQMSDSTGFNVFYFFFLFFLTDYAGVSAGVAGTISLIAITWDAVTDPIVGHISDNLRSKHGRRRPMMIASLIQYCICMYLLFNNVDLGGNALFIYFASIAILFWSSYKIFVIPYFALGAELTDDFNERTSLRAWASVLIYGAVMIASAAPPMILEKTEDSGGSGTDAWHIVGISFALVIAATILICWFLTKGGELVTKDEYVVETSDVKENVFKSFFGNIFSLFKMKPTKHLVLSVLFWSVVSSMTSGGLVYLMTNILSLSGAKQSTVFVILCLSAIAWLPLINLGSAKWDKQKVYFSFMAVSAVGLILFYFIGVSSMALVIVLVISFQFGNSTFWTLYYSMMYDISELDEFVTGKRREGTIAALMSFSQKLGAAIALWMTGMILEAGGYDGALEAQPASANDAVLLVNTLIPGIIGIGAVIFAFFYPLTRPRFEAIMKALALKKAGKDYTTEGFEELL